MSIFVKIERGIVDKAVFDRCVPAHLAYVQELNRAGRRARSGYWAERGGGMMIFEAASMEEARAIVERDPLVVHRCVEYELHEWRIAAGGSE